MKFAARLGIGTSIDTFGGIAVLLTDFIEPSLIDKARHVGRHRLLSAYRHDDPDDYRLMLEIDPRARLLLPDATIVDLHNLLALSELVKDGPKIIRPTIDLCRVLGHVDLNIHLRDYAQPYSAMGPSPEIFSGHSHGP